MQADGEDGVLVRRTERVGHLVLNRPAAINALNHAMVAAMAATLTDWSSDDSVGTVLFSGAGERGFCAGGDIVAIYAGIRDGGDAALRFWADEYTLDATIARYPKPCVALMDGLVLGGGIGISAHGSVRVVTERTRIGMPEVSIGFFPDVGGTYLLARAPGELGTHLALSGGNASGADAIALGFADNFVSSARLPEFEAALANYEVGEVLAQFAEEPPPSELLTQREWIDELYAGDDAEVIVERLGASGIPEAQQAANTIRSKSPTSVSVTLAALRRAGAMTGLEEVLDQDFRIATHLIRGSDLSEGIRAQVIDKDRNPQWSPGKLAEVSVDAVQQHFAPLGERELGLATTQSPKQ